ncbi:hypothetical protein [Cryobacterium sp. Hb1]|nr:hypothetical protein [Cryobacterium sp. Hb1]
MTDADGHPRIETQTGGAGARRCDGVSGAGGHDAAVSVLEGL